MLLVDACNLDVASVFVRHMGFRPQIGKTVFRKGTDVLPEDATITEDGSVNPDAVIVSKDTLLMVIVG